MDAVEQLLEEYLDIGENEFIKKHNHPFLLYSDKATTGGFASYHTRIAYRDGESKATETEKEVRRYRVLLPNTRAGQPHPSKLLVGRSAERDITINHSTVSKRHAFIAFDQNKKGYKLGDAGSTNGTFVDGHAVEAGEPIYIREGSLISFGDCDYLFYSPEGFVSLLKRIQLNED